MEYHDSVRPEGASVTATTNDLPSYVCPMSNMGTNTLPAQKSGVPLFCSLSPRAVTISAQKSDVPLFCSLSPRAATISAQKSGVPLFCSLSPRAATISAQKSGVPLFYSLSPHAVTVSAQEESYKIDPSVLCIGENLLSARGLGVLSFRPTCENINSAQEMGLKYGALYKT